MDNVVKEYIELIEKNKLYVELSSKLKNLKDKKYSDENKLDAKKRFISKCYEEIKQESSLIKKIFSSKSKKKIKSLNLKYLNQMIELRNEEIAKIENEILTLDLEIEEISQNLSLIDKRAENIPACLCSDGETLTVKDNIKMKFKEIEKYEKHDIDESTLMIHCTNFLPRNKTILTNYDGGKMVTITIPHDGFLKEVSALHHRHTCHFVLNNVVVSTGAGEGVWEEPMFIIIEPISEHLSQFISHSVSDAFTRGSVTLGNNPIMLVRADAYDLLPKEIFEDYDVVKYDGDYVTCLRNFLAVNDHIVFETESNDPVHAASNEYKLENNLTFRDAIINYFKNNAYKGKEQIMLNGKEFVMLFDLGMENDCWLSFSNDLIYKLSNETGISVKFLSFVILTGVIMLPNNMYTFCKDSEILSLINNLELLDADNIKRIYNSYLYNKQQLENEKEDSKEIVLFDDMKVGEYFLYENHEKCKKFMNRLNITPGLSELNDFNSIFREKFKISEEGIKIDFLICEDLCSLEELMSISNKIKKMRMSDIWYFVVEIVIPNNMSGIDALKQMKMIVQQLLQIKKRKTIENTIQGIQK